MAENYFQGVDGILENQFLPPVLSELINEACENKLISKIKISITAFQE